MHYGCECVACRHIDIRAGSRIFKDFAEVDNLGRIHNSGSGNSRVIAAKYPVVSRSAYESVVVLCEVICAEFLVVAELQLPDNCA